VTVYSKIRTASVTLLLFVWIQASLLVHPVQQHRAELV